MLIIHVHMDSPYLLYVAHSVMLRYIHLILLLLSLWDGLGTRLTT